MTTDKKSLKLLSSAVALIDKRCTKVVV